MTEHEGAMIDESDEGSDMSALECPPEAGQVGSEVDPVELALATALERASAAGQWSTVEALAAELASRRRNSHKGWLIDSAITLDATRKS